MYDIILRKTTGMTTMKSKTRYANRLLVLAISSSLVCMPLMSAEFYKWKDADGNTVYSRTPPPGEVKADIVKANTHVDPESAKSLQARTDLVDGMRDDRLKAAEDQAAAKEEVAFRQENCQRSRSRVAAYSVPRGRIVQDDGSVVVPDEDSRLVKLKEAQAWVDEWCN